MIHTRYLRVKRLKVPPSYTQRNQNLNIKKLNYIEGNHYENIIISIEKYKLVIT